MQRQKMRPAADRLVLPLRQAEAIIGGRFSVATEMMLRLLQLEHAADTVVGGEMLRGISGGERKRLTTGEMTVGCASMFVSACSGAGSTTASQFPCSCSGSSCATLRRCWQHQGETSLKLSHLVLT